MEGLIGIFFILGLIWLSMSIMVGHVKPGEAGGRIGMVLLALLCAPVVLSIISSLVIRPIVSAFWSSLAFLVGVGVAVLAVLVLGGVAFVATKSLLSGRARIAFTPRKR